MYTFVIHTLSSAPDSVTLSGVSLPELSSSTEFDAISTGWFYNESLLKINHVFQPRDDALFTLWGADVSTSSKELTSKTFTSHRNYLLPFNKHTSIPFVMKNSGEARVLIHSITGEQVRYLRSAWTKPGEYSIYCDGRDDQGNDLPSGVYVSTLITPWERSSKKIVLLN